MSSLPQSVRIREVGPRDGFQNEPEVIATAEKVRLIDLLARDRPEADRGHLVRPRRRDPAARRRRRGARRRSSAPDGVAYSVLIPNERGLERRAGATRALRRGQRLPLGLGDPQPQERQPLDRGVARRARAGDRPRPRGGAALRGRDLDLVRLPVRGRGAARARARDRRAARRRRLRGGRLRRHHRDGEPAPGRASSSPPPASALARGRADRPLPQHPRPGARQRARRARGAGSTRSSRASASSAAARCRRERPATSRPRTWSRCSTRWGSRPGSTSARCSRRPRPPRRSLGRPLGAHVLTAGPVEWLRPRRVRFPISRPPAERDQGRARMKSDAFSRPPRRQRTSAP